MPPVDGEKWAVRIGSCSNPLKPDFVILDNPINPTVGNTKETDSWHMVEVTECIIVSLIGTFCISALRASTGGERVAKAV